MDVYRPLSNDDRDDFRAFRGNVYETLETDDEGYVAEKDSLGHLVYRDVTEADNINRRNYRSSDNINFLDGDYESSTKSAFWSEEPEDDEKLESQYMYDYSMNSMINDKAHVYKGASWKDRAYYMNPGTRRFLDEKQRTDYIGFRCAMDRVGSPVGFGGQ